MGRRRVGVGSQPVGRVYWDDGTVHEDQLSMGINICLWNHSWVMGLSL